MKELRGMCVPICTPFDASGEKLDEGALREHVERMVDAGVHIILACGGTGEFAYLRHAEKRRIIELVGKQVSGRAAFMAQTSAINTADTIENARHAEGAGADAVMILPPYFEGPDAAGVDYHYEQVAKALSADIMVYNIPAASNIDITPEHFQRLLQIDNVKYIKDSTGDMVRIQELLRTDGVVFNGGDPIAFQALVAGAPGCVWGAINAMPVEAVRLYDLVQAGKLREANELWQRMLPAQLHFWRTVYNASVKAATNLSGSRIGPCRLPVQPLDAAQTAALKDALAPLGIGGKTAKVA